MKYGNCQQCQEQGKCPCPECREYEKPRCRELESKIGLKKWVFRFIFCFVCIGFLGPFLAQCILPFFSTVEESIKGIDSLAMWNQYVGIVLGIVATMLSIVSLVMGFYSASEAAEQQRKAYEQYESTIRALNRVEVRMEKLGVSSSVEKVKQGTSAGGEIEIHAEQLE